jgi:hypothetical protein
VLLPSDAPALAAWTADLLRFALPVDEWHIELHGGGRRGSHSQQHQQPSSTKRTVVLRLSWRNRLAQAIHTLRTEDGLAFGGEYLATPSTVSLPRLRAALERVGASDDSANTAHELRLDDLVSKFSPTLRALLAAIGASSLLGATAMTSEAFGLLEACAAHLPNPATSTAQEYSAALSRVSAAISMEDFHSIAYALVDASVGGKDHWGAPAPWALPVQKAAMLFNRSSHTRQQRRHVLVDHIARHWPRRVTSSSSNASSAAIVSAVRAPLCELVPNLPQLCAALISTRHGVEFGDVGRNGCRCPPKAAASLGAVMVGTHHKTGTVLLEQLVLEASKSLEGATFVKPRWVECTTALARASPKAAASLQRLPGLPSSSRPRIRILCVDEHAKSLPPLPPVVLRGKDVEHPTARQPSPFVHMIRDPLEVCASSYQYALRAKEKWLHSPRDFLGGKSYQAHYRQAPLADGLVTECQRCFKEIRQMTTLFEGSAHSPWVLTVRFEELGARYDETVRRIFGFVGLASSGDYLRTATRFERLLSVARKHDVSRRPPVASTRVAGHVSNSSQKGELRAILRRDQRVAKELEELRERLGYGGDEDGGDPGRRQQWLLATMAK